MICGVERGKRGGEAELCPIRELIEMSPCHDGVHQRWPWQGNKISFAGVNNEMAKQLQDCACTSSGSWLGTEATPGMIWMCRFW